MTEGKREKPASSASSHVAAISLCSHHSQLVVETINICDNSRVSWWGNKFPLYIWRETDVNSGWWVFYSVQCLYVFPFSWNFLKWWFGPLRLPWLLMTFQTRWFGQNSTKVVFILTLQDTEASDVCTMLHSNPWKTKTKVRMFHQTISPIQIILQCSNNL